MRARSCELVFAAVEILHAVATPPSFSLVSSQDRIAPVAGASVLALFTVGDVYASLFKRGTYAPFSTQRRSRTLFWL